MIHYHGAPISGGTLPQLAYCGKHAMVSVAQPDCLPMIADASRWSGETSFRNWELFG